jgi:glycosyltransferase involved in cell wall biosynthesis
MRPKVSVVIPSYNHEKYIRECLESILSQDYENLEVIVVEDGSTDSSVNILMEFGSRIKLVIQKNQGQAVARNNGIKLAQGSLIAFLDSDDMYVPGKIECQVRKFEEDSSTTLVYTNYFVIDSNGKEIKEVKCPSSSPDEIVQTMLTGNFICNDTVMLRRDCFEKLGYFDETIQPVTDGDMWLRLLTHGHKFEHISIPFVKYRLHSGNQCRDFGLMQRCRDTMHLKVLKTFLTIKCFKESTEWERLSIKFARQYSFAAAIEAMKVSLNQNFSIKKYLLLALFKFLNNETAILTIGLFRTYLLNKSI